MKLAYWMYAGPAHIGTLRIASSFKNVHAIMHAPLGDDYFNVMESMLERKRNFTPVTASIVDRHVLARGSEEKVINNIKRKDKEEKPDLVILTPTCTSSILQEDLQNFVNRSSIEIKADVLLADVNHYRVNEMQAADRTLEQIIQFYLKKAQKLEKLKVEKTTLPSVNIIGGFNLAFHNQHDIYELKRLFSDLKIQVNEIIPQGASVHNLKKLPNAWFNVVPYREIGVATAKYLEKEFNMPYIIKTPIGISGTSEFIKEIEQVLNRLGKQTNFQNYIDVQSRFISQSSWFAKSIDCQNLIGKKAIVFGDATHAVGITKILTKEMGINVILAGTYCKNEKHWFETEIKEFCEKIVVTDDYNVIANLIAQLKPDSIFGTQMERHIGKRLNIPCGVISAPVHIQNFPLGYRPFFGYEGANQISDLVYNCFTLGMEEHLLELFGGHDIRGEVNLNSSVSSDEIEWSEEAKLELKNIPLFVRNKVIKNTENFAHQNNIIKIDLKTMYDAKESL